MNSARQKTSLSYFTATDSYTIPEILRNARWKFDQVGLPLVTQNLTEKEDEDSLFLAHVNSCTGILQMAFNRLISPVRGLFMFKGLISTCNDQDTERGSSLSPTLQLEHHILNHSSEMNLLNNQPEFKSYQVQMDEKGPSVSVIEIELAYKKTVFENWFAEKSDLKFLVLSEKCASLIWIWNETTGIILITESSKTWSIKQWYRQILTDMALADSLVIQHPFHWHPVVRRRLLRAMKHFKRLYEIIDKQESKVQDNDSSWSARDVLHGLHINSTNKQFNVDNSTSSSTPFSIFDSENYSGILQDFEELEFSLEGKKKIMISGKKIKGNDMYDDVEMPTSKLTREKRQEIHHNIMTTTRHKLVDQVLVKWTEFSKNLAKQNNTEQVVHKSGDDSGCREIFQDYMNHLTDKIGIPPTDETSSLKLDSCFKVEKVNKNVFTVT